MNARQRVLTVADILMIYARKFLRLAPVYYSCWLLIWALSPRIVTGSISQYGNSNMETCDRDWLSTLFMASNMAAPTMVPYHGCY